MTTLTTAVTGDINDYRTVTCTGITDLATATAVEAHVWKRDVHATLTATITDVDACTIRIELGDATGWLATVATPGDWYLEVQITFADGTVLTWPQRPAGSQYPTTSECVLPVRKQGG